MDCEVVGARASPLWGPWDSPLLGQVRSVLTVSFSVLTFKDMLGPPSLSILLSQRNYWAALLLWFSLSVITAIPCTTQLESFIWTHFSLPLKRQFEHQGLKEESYGREGSLWVTVKCWTSVSKYIMFSVEPIPQSVTGIFHSWMDGQISNKMSCRLSSREVQDRLPRGPFQLSDSLNVWLIFWKHRYQLVYLSVASDLHGTWAQSRESPQGDMNPIEEFREETS